MDGANEIAPGWPATLGDVGAILARAAGLPGGAAHELLAPAPRPGWDPGVLAADARPAAALVLLLDRGAGPAVLLTVRGVALRRHAGQISFPGGRVEDGETIPQAALREAAEEVGLPAGAARIVAPLSPLYIPVSGFGLHPFAALCAAPPERWRPQPEEVARIVEAPLALLADPASLGVERRAVGGVDYRIPYFRVGQDKVWGATAMVLAELLWLLGRPPRVAAEEDA
ncbi:CoA pyrophosphatase [bacterium]|nr:CoA pyrophosphatase [bacterium]